MLVSKSMSSPFISNSPLLNVYMLPPGAWDTVTQGWRAACFPCCHPINPLFPPAVLCDSWSNTSVFSRRINCLRYLQITKGWENILHDENPFKCPLKKKKNPDRLLPCPSLSTSAKNLEATKKQALQNSRLEGDARDRGPGWRYECKATSVGRRKENDGKVEKMPSVS